MPPLPSPGNLSASIDPFILTLLLWILCGCKAADKNTCNPEESQINRPFKIIEFTPELQMNTTYAVYAGGEASGTITNGVYSDGSYTPGKPVANPEISSVLTTLGNFESGWSGGGRRGRRGNRP